MYNKRDQLVFAWKEREKQSKERKEESPHSVTVQASACRQAYSRWGLAQDPRPQNCDTKTALISSSRSYSPSNATRFHKPTRVTLRKHPNTRRTKVYIWHLLFSRNHRKIDKRRPRQLQAVIFQFVPIFLPPST